MKRKILMTLALSLSLTAFAVGANAERYLSNGSYSAYIGENDYTYVVFPTGTTKMLEQPSKDLLSMTDTQVILLTQDNKLYAINLNEANTTVEMLSNNATQDAIDAVTAQKPYTLENGVLSLVGTGTQPVVVANNVVMAGANSTNLYFLDNGGATLKSIPLDTAAGTLPTATQVGPGVAGALSMNVSENGIVMVAADHTMTIVSLSDNSYKYYTTAPDTTVAGVLAGSKLLCFSQDADGVYHLNASVDNFLVSGTPSMVVTATATPAATRPVATATATPRATAKPTARPTTKPSSSDDTTYATVRYGSKGSRVKKMQKRLAALGYPVGNVDGSFGDATLYALNLFQGDAGYTERTYANSSVLEKLYSKKAPSYDAFATLKSGKKGIRVTLLQTYLRNAGYDPGTIDGSFGANTKAAVEKFQAAQNIPVTGIADTTTLILLYGKDGPVYPVPTPTPVPSATPTPTVSPSEKPTEAPTTTPPEDPTEAPTETPTPSPSTDPEPGTKTDL